MRSRTSQFAFFDAYENPSVNITAEASCADFVSAAKARGLPPFAILLQGIGRTSLDIENFRWRALEGRLCEVSELKLSHTVLGSSQQLNFSTIPYLSDLGAFVEAYRADQAEAARTEELRLVSLEDRDYLFVTCLPWLRFTAIEHPIASYADDSIPKVAIGRFDHVEDRVTFPISVQVHHGLVDGLHIHQYIQRLEEVMAEATNTLTSSN